MELLKNPIIACLIVLTCAVVVYFANKGNVFGKFINRFAPCTQDPTASFPCYGGYDIVIMLVAGIIGVVFVFVLLSRLFDSTT